MKMPMVYKILFQQGHRKEQLLPLPSREIDLGSESCFVNGWVILGK